MGDSLLEEENKNLYKLDGYLTVDHENFDYLLGKKVLKWKLNTKNEASTTFGEYDNLYLITIVDQKGTTGRSV